MDKLEKVLTGITIGGLLLNKAIPSEYVRAEAISLLASALSCTSYFVKRVYETEVRYNLSDEEAGIR